ncbi:ABC transporter permease [Paenibacillus cymbidii]|uniref:ABC transporter permease n=1 Tax=Paenibacillus cymbidii TaxID=1639034 RepID=UPI0010810AFC|nr:ABC-2 family transporter protein [Paenibacillus cymbidii]
MIGAYLEFIRLRFLTMLAYRVNYYSGIAIYLINIGAQYFMWKAIYAGNDAIVGMSMTQMTTYVAVSYMARAFYFNNLDREIANDIRDGSVAIQFIRPYQYLLVKMMQGAGEGLFRLLLFSTPGMVLVWLLFPVRLPSGVGVWLLFLLMLVFSFLINSQINILTGLCAFFLENNEGLMRMKRVAVDLFSGLIVPIAFFPAWAKDVLELLPFQAITYLPGAVFSGYVSGVSMGNVLAVQAFWCALLTAPIVLMWRTARTRLFVQGG